MNTRKQGSRKDRIIEEQRTEIARLKRMVGNLNEEIEGYESDIRVLKAKREAFIYTALTFIGIILLYGLCLRLFYL